jgi:hypothetical protein
VAAQQGVSVNLLLDVTAEIIMWRAQDIWTTQRIKYQTQADVDFLLVSCHIPLLRKPIRVNSVISEPPSIHSKRIRKFRTRTRREFGSRPLTHFRDHEFSMII